MEMKLIAEGINHIGYVVENMEKQLAEISKIFKPVKIEKYKFQPMRAWCYGKKMNEYELEIAMVFFKENHTGIEIIQPLSEGIHKDFVKEKSQGLHHICISTEGEYEAWKNFFVFQKADIIFESETEDSVIGYRRCFYAKNQQGNIVEVKEKPYFRDAEKGAAYESCR